MRIFFYLSAFCLCSRALFADSLYVSSNIPGTVSVIDISTFQVVATITVGSFPQGGIVTPNQQRVYIANTGSDNVSVIDTSTNLVIATISTGDGPQAGAVTPNGQFVYIPNAISDNISVISTATNAVIATIVVSDTSNLITLSQYPFALPNGQFVYFAPGGTNNIIKVSTATNTITATIPTGGTLPNDNAQSLTGSPDGSTIYVLDANGKIFAISTASDMVIATIPTGSGGSEMQISSNGLFLYVNNNASSNINCISTTSNTVVATISTAAAPAGFMAVSPNGNVAYTATDLSGQTVLVVSHLTGTVIATISEPGNSEAELSSPDGSLVFSFVFPNGLTGNNVSVINTSSNSIIATVPVPFPLYGVYVRSNAPTPSALAPTGEQIQNQFLTQTDLVNIVRWTPPTNFTPVAYKIFRDADLTVLAATVSGSTLEFEDHNRKKRIFYSYFIVAIDAEGNTFDMGSVTVVPIF